MLSVKSEYVRQGILVPYLTHAQARVSELFDNDDLSANGIYDLRITNAESIIYSRFVM